MVGKIKILNLIIIVIMFSSAVTAQKQFNVADFGVTPATTDCTPGIIRCLNACKEESNSLIIFPKGVYHFYPDFGTDKYYFISNNDEGLKRIIFFFDNLENITIDGQGSSFIFHSFVNPFVLENASNIQFRNFSVDFARPFHSEGIVLANNDDGIDIEIPANFPFEINNGVLIFTDDEKKDNRETSVFRYENYDYGNILEYDTQKKETAYMVHDHYLGGTPLPAKSLGDKKVRLYHDRLKATVGNTVVFSPSKRYYPIFTLNSGKDILFNNITIYNSGGMGIIGMKTHNVTVESCKVTPQEGRMISCTADATHFVNCTGKIILSNCLFENQMDDATNIHGIYAQIVKQISSDEIIVQLKHIQQLGFDFLKPGVHIEFVKGASMITKGTAKVIEAERINKDFTYVKLDQRIPSDIMPGDVIGENGASLFVHIKGNTIRRNRARGILLNSRGKTIVENNYFHSPGAAILFEGDAQYWFEQGGVSDCTISNNVFDNCMFGIWGKAVIDFQPGIEKDKEISRYNKNIKIKDNTFRIFDESPLLQAICVDGLTWENNKIERTTDYPAFRKSDQLFQVTFSDNVFIDQK